MEDRADLPPPGRLVADDDGARVQCHICGAFYPKLGTHVRRGHGLSPDEYREQFGLNRGTALASPALRRKLSARLGPLLIAMQPAENPLFALRRAGAVRRDWTPRAEFRLRRSELARQQAARRPRPEKPAPLSNAEVRARALQRIAELRQDPAWVASWRQRVQAVLRRLTDDQVAEIRALRGVESATVLAERYGVHEATIRRVWRGRAGTRRSASE